MDVASFIYLILLIKNKLLHGYYRERGGRERERESYGVLSVKRWGRKRFNLILIFCVMGSVCVSVYKNPKPLAVHQGERPCQKTNDALLILGEIGWFWGGIIRLLFEYCSIG